MTLTFADKLFDNINELKNTSYKLSNSIALEATTEENKEVNAKIYGLDYQLGTNSFYCIKEEIGDVSYNITTSTNETYTDQKDEVILNINGGKLMGGNKKEIINAGINSLKKAESNKFDYETNSTNDKCSFNLNYNFGDSSSPNIQNIAYFSINKTNSSNNWYYIQKKIVNLPTILDNSKFSCTFENYNKPDADYNIIAKFDDNTPFIQFKLNYNSGSPIIEPLKDESGNEINIINLIQNIYYLHNIRGVSYFLFSDNEITENIYLEIYGMLGKVIYDIPGTSETITPTKNETYVSSDGKLSINVTDYENFKMVVTYKDCITINVNNLPTSYSISRDTIEYHKYDIPLNITKNDAFKPYPALFITSEDITPPDTYTNSLTEEIKKLDTTNSILNNGVLYTVPRYERQ